MFQLTITLGIIAAVMFNAGVRYNAEKAAAAFGASAGLLPFITHTCGSMSLRRALRSASDIVNDWLFPVMRSEFEVPTIILPMAVLLATQFT